MQHVGPGWAAGPPEIEWGVTAVCWREGNVSSTLPQAALTSGAYSRNFFLGSGIQHCRWKWFHLPSKQSCPVLMANFLKGCFVFLSIPGDCHQTENAPACALHQVLAHTFLQGNGDEEEKGERPQPGGWDCVGCHVHLRIPMASLNPLCWRCCISCVS